MTTLDPRTSPAYYAARAIFQSPEFLRLQTVNERQEDEIKALREQVSALAKRLDTVRMDKADLKVKLASVERAYDRLHDQAVKRRTGLHMTAFEEI